MIALERHIRADRINRILNHPQVRPWVADSGEGVIDITPAVSDQRNYLLMGEHGGIMFFHLMPGLYECHTQVLPEGRGRWATQLTAACANYMFTETDCVEILTRIPHGHDAPKMLAIMQGMKHEFTRPKEECLFNGKHVPVDIYSYKIQEWVGGAEEIDETGRIFHEKLNAWAKKLGVTQPAHAEDYNHNRYVGAAVEMALAGQAWKATAFYNRWALVSRHAPIQLISENPPTVRMDLGILKFIDGDIEVIRPC